MNWIEEPAPTTAMERQVDVKIRSASPAVPAMLRTAAPDGRVSIVFDEPAFAPAPGQAVVVYVGDAVLCGGVVGGIGPVPDRAQDAASARGSQARETGESQDSQGQDSQRQGTQSRSTQSRGTGSQGTRPQGKAHPGPTAGGA